MASVLFDGAISLVDDLVLILLTQCFFPSLE